MPANAWIASIIDVATAAGVGVRVVREEGRPSEQVLADASHALAAHGFVVLTAARHLANGQMPGVAGRHVALICFPEDDRPTGAAFGRKVVWSHPAFANKCIFVRNDKEVACFSLAAE